jgi:hypothetical protein
MRHRLRLRDAGRLVAHEALPHALRPRTSGGRPDAGAPAHRYAPRRRPAAAAAAERVPPRLSECRRSGGPGGAAAEAASARDTEVRLRAPVR